MLTFPNCLIFKNVSFSKLAEKFAASVLRGQRTRHDLRLPAALRSHRSARIPTAQVHSVSRECFKNLPENSYFFVFLLKFIFFQPTLRSSSRLPHRQLWSIHSQPGVSWNDFRNISFLFNLALTIWLSSSCRSCGRNSPIYRSLRLNISAFLWLPWCMTLVDFLGEK